MDHKPNIVFCTCDQLRPFELGCYGNGVIRTPHIDRLAREGVRFQHAVSNNPVCMPARTSMLTGQYSRTCCEGRLGNFAVQQHDGQWVMPEYPDQDRTQMLDPTLPELLRGLGYETALVGKWHIQVAPSLVGFRHSVYPFVHHRHTHQTYIGNDGREEVATGFSPDYEARRVADFLRRKRDRPFFLFYNISPPHMPLLDAPEQYLRMYSPDEAPLRPNVYRDGKLPWDEHWFKIYLWDFLYYDQHQPHTSALPAGFDLRHLTALYYGMTSWMDEMVGRLMRNLAANGLADDTIVVFLSDHGDQLGSHQLFNKGTLLEESIRIPLIFHAPGRLAPRVNAGQVASIVDVAPTLLALCGALIPAFIQGQNLLPLLMGEKERLEENSAFIETTSGPIGIRTPTHLYGADLGVDDRTPGECCQFYDLDADPWELNNLAGQDRQCVIARALRNRLEAWHRQTPWTARAATGRHGRI